MLDWLIIGGGVHGTHLSHALRHRAGVSEGRIRVIDPHDRPLDSFFRMAEATGMKHMRSPGVHHIDLHPMSLLRFARKGAGKRLARFLPPYDRPGVEFFRAHTERIVSEHRLGELRLRAQARRIERAGGGFSVETDQGKLQARRVVLALGLGEQPCRPGWAGGVEHIFAPTFRRETLSSLSSVAIVGGGISAAQLACSLSSAGVQVTIVARHPPRVHRFDSEPGWLGPRYMDSFLREPDPSRRRGAIAKARHRGSMPPEVAARLHAEMRAGRVRWVEASVEGVEGSRLLLGGGKGHVEAERVALATGFEAHRPGGALLDDEAIERLGLPCAACGYPILPPSLEWSRGLFVSGPLAELELGPTSRNIAGARAAAERLVAA